MASTPVFDPADPAWLAHRYDAAGDRLLFRHVPRAMHRDGPFLTDALIGDRPQAIIASAEGVAAARAHAGRIHFIFHSAFCASTLLVRSEEHTSELQSLMRNSYDVYCMKKKT